MIHILRYFIFSFIYALGRVFPKPGIPVLFYHSLDESGSILSVGEDNFLKQIKYLVERGYSSLSISEFKECLKSGNFPKKRILITFDDGYKNNIGAVKVLKKFNFSAVIFVATNFIGKFNDFCKEDVPRLPMLTREDILYLSKMGVEFGAHSHTHRNMTDLTGQEIASEIKESKLILQEQVGKPIDYFCYPRGKANDDISSELARQEFKIAFLSKTGVVSRNTSPYFLPRLPVNGNGSLVQFKALLSPWYGLFRNLFK